jgi:hypothetical protein
MVDHSLIGPTRLGKPSRDVKRMGLTAAKEGLQRYVQKLIVLSVCESQAQG